MENCTKKMKLDSDPATKNEIQSTSAKTLLDMSDCIIEKVFDHLNLADKMNFGLSCKKFNNILNNCTKYWENVWLNIQHKDSQVVEVSDLTRKYKKVKYNNYFFGELFYSDEIKEKDKEIWAHLGPNLNALQFGFVQHNDFSEFDVLLCTINPLPYLENLVHWEFSTSHDDFFHGRFLNAYRPAAPFEMKKLEHLVIENSFFLLLQNGFVNFSTNSLRTFKLVSATYEDADDPDLGLTLPLDKRVLLPLIERQTNLKVLRLEGIFNSMFNKPLMLKNVQLKEIGLLSKDEIFNAQQQKNLYNFLQSQTELDWTKVEIRFDGQKSNQFLNHQMKLLDSPLISRVIVIISKNENDGYEDEDDEDQGVVRSIISSTDFNLSEFLLYPHQENLMTESLNVRLQIATDMPRAIDILCTKFPNLKHVQVELFSYSNRESQELDLSSWGKLEKVESFKLENRFRKSTILRFLATVTFTNLKEFSYCYNFKSVEGLKNMRDFLARHVQITRLKIIFEDGGRMSKISTAERGDYCDVVVFALKTLKNLSSLETTFIDLTQREKFVLEMKAYGNVGLTLKMKSPSWCSYYERHEFTLVKETDTKIVIE